MVGNPENYKPESIIPDEQITKTLGPYTIDQYFTIELITGNPSSYNISVSLPDKLVVLEPYLGAMGHSVIIKAGTLEYIHAHASSMSMEGMEAMSPEEHMHHQPEPNAIEFEATFPAKGIYKIFTQFQHNKKVFTTDYIVEVKQ
jgi:hypothetical protein